MSVVVRFLIDLRHSRHFPVLVPVTGPLDLGMEPGRAEGTEAFLELPQPYSRGMSDAGFPLSRHPTNGTPDTGIAAVSVFRPTCQDVGIR